MQPEYAALNCETTIAHAIAAIGDLNGHWLRYDQRMVRQIPALLKTKSAIHRHRVDS
jgi:hypothetical protein